MRDVAESGLVVDGLVKGFGPTLKVVDRIGFSLPQGTFFTLLGPSGCGKTTTLRCIAGLEQPDEGVISVGGTTIFDPAARINVPMNRRRFGMVFQSYAIWPHLTVFENVAFPLRVTKQPRATIAGRVHDALTAVGLAHLAERSATRLSGGQQQRVALARAIVHHPRLLLLDEPLSNLDAVLREEMRAELKRLQRELGITTVYVTHDQSEALEMSDMIAVLHRGHLVQLAPPANLFYRPRDAFVAGFLGSPNILPASHSQSAAADSIAVVTLASGERIICCFPHAVAANSDIAVSIRSERITVLLADEAVPGGWNTLAGVVRAIGFQGQTVRYTIGVGSMTMEATEDFARRREIGSTVTLAFPPDAALGLQKETR